MNVSGDPLVTIVILNWNGIEDTLACLESLQQTTYANKAVVVVDNGSTDGSRQVLCDRRPGITLIENGENEGFSVGCNQGIRASLEMGADYVLLLNNDTTVAPDLIERLVEPMERDVSISATGPKIVLFDDPETIWSAGGIVDYGATVTRHRGYLQKDSPDFNRPGPVDYLPGCALAIRRAALETVGMLDPKFSPAYFEDSDWCLRARKLGFQVWFEPGGVVLHKVSGSTGGEYNPVERYLIGYHAVTFMRRHASLVQWLKFIVLGIFSLPLLYLVKVFQRNGAGVLAKARGLRDAFLGRPLAVTFQ